MRALPLRHDVLEPELASVPKHGRTVLGLGQSSQLCLGCQRLANCARQRGVSCSIFEAKQAAMRALFGIAELHSIIASPMQAARRAAVASSWASAAVGSTPMSKPTAASIPLQLLIMTISLRVHRRRCRYRPAMPLCCDGICLLFLRSTPRN